METALNSTLNSQKEAFRLQFAAGLLNPFSRMNVSVRLGQLALNILSRWPIKPLPQKPESGVNYLTIAGRSHWLLLRESLLSVYNTWQVLPQIAVVSDGTWEASEFEPVFAWWPGHIAVKSPADICEQADAAGETELRQYAEKSPYGLKLAAIVMLARARPILFVDVDILWFRDPAELIGSPETWGKVRGVRESQCFHHRQLALRHCPEVLNPPYVNGGMLTLKGELLPSPVLREMVRAALADSSNGAIEQTIIATAVHGGGGLLASELCLTEFDDAKKYRHRNMLREGYFSRHYVNWMRHQFYRDAVRLRCRGSRLKFK